MTATSDLEISELKAVTADDLEGPVVGYLADGYHDPFIFVQICKQEFEVVIHPENVQHIYYCKNYIDHPDVEVAWIMTVVEPHVEGAIAATWVEAFTKQAAPGHATPDNENEDPKSRTN